MMLCSACSNKGVHMPKHRKKTHCNCPTFSYNEMPQNSIDYTV